MSRTPCGTPATRRHGSSRCSRRVALEEYFAELAPILQRHEPPQQYYGLAERYGITIEDSWIEELETTYGVKL